MLCENLRIVQETVANACVKSNRPKEDVTLIAVSKTKPVSMLREVYDAGCRHFGENKVQEFLSKKDELKLSGVEKHLIGHLQTNKVREIINEVDNSEGVTQLC